MRFIKMQHTEGVRLLGNNIPILPGRQQTGPGNIKFIKEKNKHEQTGVSKRNRSKQWDQ